MTKSSEITLQYTIQPKISLTKEELKNSSVKITVAPYGNRFDTIYTEVFQFSFDTEPRYSGTFSFIAPEVEALEIRFDTRSDKKSSRDYRYIVFKENTADLIDPLKNYDKDPLPSLKNQKDDPDRTQKKPYHLSPSELTTEQLQKIYYLIFKIQDIDEKESVEKIVGDLSNPLYYDKHRKLYLIQTTLANVFKVKELLGDCEIFEEEPPGLEELKNNRTIKRQ